MPFSARKRETACLHSHYYRISLQVNKLKIPELFKIHFMKRLPAVLVTVFSVAAFGLYYIGVYDISFIERPESWKGNLDAFIAVLDKSYKVSPTPEETEPEENGTAGTDGTGENSSKPGGSGTNNARPGGESHAEILTFDAVSALKEKGYSLTDKVYDSSCVFGILETSYALPDKLTGTLKTFDRENFITYDDGRETEREIVKDQKNRYALEMYMGYIIYDDNGTLYLIGPDGSVLTAFDDTQYIPAYTRDLQGRPLFYRNNSYSIKYPTSKSDPDENGDSEWYDTANLKVDDRIYYYLSPNGQNFIKSDYNDVTDNRGLYFDYPSYYGNPDSSLKRYYLNTTKVLTDLEGKTSLLYCPLWCFSRTKLDFGLLKFDKEGNNLAEEGGKSLSEMFPYTKAYSYSENYASVMTDIKWDYYHEEENADGTKENKYYEVTSNEMRVVDSTGRIMFDSRKNYYSELGWTANERYAEPLSRGLASLGSYYFDHGYMRLRVQSYDRYYFTDLDSIFIVSDEDVLVDPRGNKFPIPSGYNLISYSDGILLLEKDGLYGYLNTSGVWIRKPDMTDASTFLEGVAVCKNSEGSYGVIDTNGKAVIPFRYDYISDISSGTMLAYSNSSGWKIFQKMTAG